MSAAYSLIVGVEEYYDERIPDVGHASKDARAFAAALKALGVADADLELLVNGSATRSNVLYGLKQCLGSAGPDDSVFVFFSGHGFSAPDGSYLNVHDSRFGSMVDTSISLTEVFELMRDSRSRKIALFLDCCHAGLNFPAKEKSVLAQMDAAEIKRFFDKSEYHVAFGSCKGSEKSYWSDTLEHGVWTYHLLQALQGKVPQILEKDRYLRAAALQDYLANSVPITLRDTFTERRTQTPVLYGSLSNNFLIADLDPVLPKPAVVEEVIAKRIKKASFGDAESGAVSTLPGFDRKKKHFPPIDHSRFAEDFIARIGNEKVEQKADELFAAIKDAFGYTRQELKMTKETGSAIIRAKDFDVALSISQSKDDPADYRFDLEVDEISGPEIVAGDEFNEVFSGEFSFLKVSLPTGQDIPALIDSIEAQKPKGIRISYSNDQEPSTVSISVDGVRARFVVGRTWIKVKLHGAEPKAFVDALGSVQNLGLGGKLTLGGLLFGARRPALE